MPADRWRWRAHQWMISARCCARAPSRCSINTAARRARREFVKEAAEKFGDQCIVVAIDAKNVSAEVARSLGDFHLWRPQ